MRPAQESKRPPTWLRRCPPQAGRVTEGPARFRVCYRNGLERLERGLSGPGQTAVLTCCDLGPSWLAIRDREASAENQTTGREDGTLLRKSPLAHGPPNQAARSRSRNSIGANHRFARTAYPRRHAGEKDRFPLRACVGLAAGKRSTPAPWPPSAGSAAFVGDSAPWGFAQRGRDKYDESSELRQPLTIAPILAGARRAVNPPWQGRITSIIDKYATILHIVRGFRIPRR
jgi:hypothetical protein